MQINLSALILYALAIWAMMLSTAALGWWCGRQQCTGQVPPVVNVAPAQVNIAPALVEIKPHVVNVAPPEVYVDVKPPVVERIEVAAPVITAQVTVTKVDCTGPVTVVPPTINTAPREQADPDGRLLVPPKER